MNKISKIKSTDYLEGTFKFVSEEIVYMNESNFSKSDLKKADVLALGMTMIDILLRLLTRRQVAGERRCMVSTAEKRRLPQHLQTIHRVTSSPPNRPQKDDFKGANRKTHHGRSHRHD